MKTIINSVMSLAMLGAVYWTYQNIIMADNPTPIGGNGPVDIDSYRGEIDTFRELQ